MLSISGYKIFTSFLQFIPGFSSALALPLQRRKLGAVVDYAPVTLFSQDAKYGPNTHAYLNSSRAGDDLAGDLGALIQLNDGQIIGRQPIEVLGGSIDSSIGDNGARPLEGVIL